MFLFPGRCAKPLTVPFTLSVIIEATYEHFLMPVELFEQCLSLNMMLSHKNEYSVLHSLPKRLFLDSLPNFPQHNSVYSIFKPFLIPNT